jgi:hypothetical protein
VNKRVRTAGSGSEASAHTVYAIMA